MTESNVSVIDFAGEPLGVLQRTLEKDRVIEGDPHHTVQSFFENETGELVAGVWESTPGKWHAFTGGTSSATSSKATSGSRTHRAMPRRSRPAMPS